MCPQFGHDHFNNPYRCKPYVSAHREKYSESVKTLCTVLNGRPGVDGFRTFQPGWYSLSSLKADLRTALTRVILSGQPGVPSLNKWTKFGPSNDFWMIGTFWNILPKLCDLAWSELEISLRKAVSRVEKVANALGSDNAADPEVSVQVSWHHVAGTRYAKLDRTLHDAVSIFIITCNAVVLEPNRYLALFFMAVSNCPRDYSRFSPLLNLLNDEYSVVTACLQYYASLLEDGGGGRLRLIWMRLGCKNFSEWHATYPEQVQYFKRMVLHMIGQTEYRHIEALKEHEVFSLGDSRLSLEVRSGIATRVKHKDIT